jgi:hypothetical protein
MNLSLRSRLVAMALVIIALAAIIVGAAAVTLRQVKTLRRHFSGVRIESFRIADYLQASVLDLNATLLRYVLGRNLIDWQRRHAALTAQSRRDEIAHLWGQG